MPTLPALAGQGDGRRILLETTLPGIAGVPPASGPKVRSPTFTLPFQNIVIYLMVTFLQVVA